MEDPMRAVRIFRKVGAVPARCCRCGHQAGGAELFRAQVEESRIAHRRNLVVGRARRTCSKRAVLLEEQLIATNFFSV